MKQFETRIGIVPLDEVELLEVLNQLGKEGFEFKGFVPKTYEGLKIWRYAIFQRELSKEIEGE